MFMRSRSFISFAALLAVFVAAAAMAAVPGSSPRIPSTFLIASGQEVTFNVVDPGTATCIGGTATGNPYNPCAGSHRIFLKHQVVQTSLLPGATGNAVPLLAGVNTVTLDCNLDGNLKGTCWGKFEWVVDSGAMWAGPVSGRFDFSTFVFSYRLNGGGFGGTVDGMHLEYDADYNGGFTGDFVARIHVPPGQTD